MSMIEAIVTGLVLAAVSGITIVAYKHPRGYKRIMRALMVLLVVVLLGAACFLAGWAMVVKKAVHVARTIADNREIALEEHLDRLLEAIRDLPDVLLYLVIGNVVALAYLLFLRFLPHILGLPVDKDTKDEEKLAHLG